MNNLLTMQGYENFPFFCRWLSLIFNVVFVFLLLKNTLYILKSNVKNSQNRSGISLLSQNFIFIAFIYLSLNQVYNHFFLRCISAAFFIEIFIYISIYILARFLSVFSSSFHCAIFHHCVTWHEWRQQKTKKPKLVPSLSFSFSFFYFRLHLAY